jgi:hypothetical protein
MPPSVLARRTRVRGDLQIAAGGGGRQRFARPDLRRIADRWGANFGRSFSVEKRTPGARGDIMGETVP